MRVEHKAQKLTPIFRSISQLVEEGTIKLKDDGLEIVVADPAMVAMVDAHFEPEFFNQYEPIDVDEDELDEDKLEDDDTDKEDLIEEHQSVAVNFELLTNVLRGFDDDANVTITPKGDSLEDDPRLQIETTRGDDVTIELLQLDEDVPSTDDLEFTREGEFEIGDLKDALDRATIFGDSLDFTFKDEVVTVTAEGDMGRGAHDFDVSQVDGDEEVTTMLSADYLKKMRKGINRFDKNKANIRMGQDFPCELEVSGVSYGFTYILAPRIEEE